MLDDHLSKGVGQIPILFVQNYMLFRTMAKSNPQLLIFVNHFVVVFSTYKTGIEYMETVNIDVSMKYWNLLALGGIALFFLALTYVQLRRMKKFTS